MTEGSALINRSATICHYTRFWRILRANSNGYNFTGSEIADLLRLFAENGLKQSGMFWTIRGANAIIALRCCHLNGRFETYWEGRRAA